MLLVDNKDTLPDHLKHGVRVQLFQPGAAQPMLRISLRLLDAHLHRVHVHPVQLPLEKLRGLVRRVGVKQHVKDLIDNKLLQCVPAGPNPTRTRGTRPIYCKYSALQYIIRQDCKINDPDYRFDTHIHPNLVRFVKQKSFNKKYLQRILKELHGEDIEVCTYVRTYIYIRTYVHAYIHIHIHTYVHTYIHTCMHAYVCTYIHR